MTRLQQESVRHSAAPRARAFGPTFTLLVLAPVVTNVLFGAIPISMIFAVIPATAAWGLGAVLIRDLTRRLDRGWPTILILGAALAITEECVFLQTSLFPLIGVDPSKVYGRAFDVNWPYLLWAVGYETVWAVALPILLVEWIYPSRSERPWMSSLVLTFGFLAFLGMGLVRWYGWTQVFIPENFPRWAHRPSAVTIGIAVGAIASLVVLALRTEWAWSRQEATVPAPPLWLVAITALVGGLMWSVLLFLAYGAMPSLAVEIPLAGGVTLAAIMIVIITRWVRRPGWSELHTLMLASGALVASMSAGFLVLKGIGGPPSDFIGKGILNGIAILGLAVLGAKIRNRMNTDSTPLTQSIH